MTTSDEEKRAWRAVTSRMIEGMKAQRRFYLDMLDPSISAKGALDRKIRREAEIREEEGQ